MNMPSTPLCGKTISCLGDSITEGVGGQGQGWTVVLQQRFPDARVLNYGIAGTRIAEDPQGSQAFVSRLHQLDPSSDIILVFGGINDFNHSLPLGLPEERNPATFTGALNLIADTLQRRFPCADLMFITPMKAFGFKNYPHWDSENAQGLKLIHYRDAIRQVALQHSIPVLDLFAESGLTPDIPELKEIMMPDGLHPSPLGHQRIARKIAAAVLSRL